MPGSHPARLCWIQDQSSHIFVTGPLSLEARVSPSLLCGWILVREPGLYTAASWWWVGFKPSSLECCWPWLRGPLRGGSIAQLWPWATVLLVKFKVLRTQIKFSSSPAVGRDVSLYCKLTAWTEVQGFVTLRKFIVETFTGILETFSHSFIQIF